MQLIYLDDLKRLSGYTDRRSVKKFLASIQVRLLKVGKKYCVNKDEFNAALVAKFALTQKHNQMRQNLRNQYEKDFLKDLQQFLSRV